MIYMRFHRAIDWGNICFLGFLDGSDWLFGLFGNRGSVCTVYHRMSMTVRSE
jgi:hypothetical protein